jgi:hypothetical protein
MKLHFAAPRSDARKVTSLLPFMAAYLRAKIIKTREGQESKLID